MTNITNLPTSTYFTLEQVGHGIYVAIIKDGQGAWANAGIIDLGEEVLVIDTFLTPKAATELKRVAEEVTEKPIKHVVNTHSHFDHTLGNQVFVDTDIIATNLSAEQLKSGIDFEKIEETSTAITRHIEFLANNLKAERDPAVGTSRLWEVREFQKLLEAIREIKVTLPTITFNDEYCIKGSKKAAEIYTYGGGHSKSDAFVFLPEEKVLFAGDLIFVENHPSIHTQTPEEWMVILNKMKVFDIEKIVVGHGPVGNKENIDTMITYFEHIIEVVEDAIQQGKAKEELLNSPIPEAYKNWGMLQVYGENLEKVYHQRMNRSTENN